MWCMKKSETCESVGASCDIHNFALSGIAVGPPLGDLSSFVSGHTRSCHATHRGNASVQRSDVMNHG